MISNVTDLKNRTLVESNTLKSFILSAHEGFKVPERDDILIHDYQIANSVTINTILSNYIVNLKWAWKLYDESMNETGESYFQILEYMPEENDYGQLNDNTKLFLAMKYQDGTKLQSFFQRELAYDIDEIKDIPEGTIGFINLTSIWYGHVRLKLMDDEQNPVLDADENPIYHDGLEIVNSMNNFVLYENPFGVNPFEEVNLANVEEDNPVDDWTFNKFVKEHAENQGRSISINCIVENLFYKSDIEQYDKDSAIFGNIIPKCKYIVCLTDGMYGLQPVWNSENKFIKFKCHDISSLIPNIDQALHAKHKYEFNICGFHVINKHLTMFVVFNEQTSDTKQYHYVFLNEDSYDKVYGFTQIESIVVDSMITEPSKVFNKIESLRTLDNVSIAMTDYGFWDLEKNTTNNKTYSFRGQDKRYEVTSWDDFNGLPNSDSLNCVTDKIILPTKDQIWKKGDVSSEYNLAWKLDNEDSNYM